MWLPPGRLSTLGKTLGMAGKGPLAVSQQETRVPKFSQTSASSTEEGKVHGEQLPYSHPTDLLARVGPIPIA